MSICRFYEPLNFNLGGLCGTFKFLTIKSFGSFPKLILLDLIDKKLNLKVPRAKNCGSFGGMDEQKKYKYVTIRHFEIYVLGFHNLCN